MVRTRGRKDRVAATAASISPPRPQVDRPQASDSVASDSDSISSTSTSGSRKSQKRLPHHFWKTLASDIESCPKGILEFKGPGHAVERLLNQKVSEDPTRALLYGDEGDPIRKTIQQKVWKWTTYHDQGKYYDLVVRKFNLNDRQQPAQDSRPVPPPTQVPSPPPPTITVPRPTSPLSPPTRRRDSPRSSPTMSSTQQPNMSSQGSNKRTAERPLNLPIPEGVKNRFPTPDPNDISKSIHQRVVWEKFLVKLTHWCTVPLYSSHNCECKQSLCWVSWQIHDTPC